MRYLRKMFPCFSSFYATHTWLGDAIPLCYFRLRSMIHANHNNLFICKFRTMICLSFSLIIAMLSISVQYIVSLGSNKEVLWIATRRGIAFVEYVKIIGNWANVKLVCNSMRKFCLPHYTDTPIVSSLISCCPKPASSIRLHHNLFFEPFLKGFSFFEGNLSDKLFLSHVSSYIGHVVRAALELPLLGGPSHYNTMETIII